MCSSPPQCTKCDDGEGGRNDRPGETMYDATRQKSLRKRCKNQPRHHLHESEVWTRPGDASHGMAMMMVIHVIDSNQGPRGAGPGAPLSHRGSSCRPPRSHFLFWDMAVRKHAIALSMPSLGLKWWRPAVFPPRHPMSRARGTGMRAVSSAPPSRLPVVLVRIPALPFAIPPFTHAFPVSRSRHKYMDEQQMFSR